ncbi:hypothetical protein QO189_07375 [Psychrobacter sp. Arc29]|uniref:hypothetical protein n=1 Tax=Psychrobacter sp. Arc29 TaxID=3046690 RepID=UPI00352D44CC
MAITLQDLKPKQLGSVEREIDYDGLVKLTMRVGDDKAFQSAYVKIQESQGDKKVTKDKLSKASFDENELSFGESLLYLMGEYLITEWDVLLPDGEVAPINGDNFTKLVAALGDNGLGFATHIFDTFKELSQEFALQAGETKKKPLRSGSGTKKAAS